MSGDLSFEYLKLDGEWPRFTVKDLEQGEDGSLTLARVPLLLGELGADGDVTLAPSVTTPSEPEQSQLPPAGIATTPECICDVYVSDPARDIIWRWEGCEHVAEALPLGCGPADEEEDLSVAGRPSPVVRRLNAPSGLASLNTPAGLRLYVADSGNHRIVVFDPETWQILEIWGQADPYDTPQPGSKPGLLDTPTGVATDQSKNLYVLDSGNARVQKFSWRGVLDPSFWEEIESGPTPPVAPVNVSIGRDADTDVVYILDKASGGESENVNEGEYRALLFDTAGNVVARPLTPIPLAGVPDPISLAAHDGKIYLGCADGSVIKVSVDGAGKVRIAAMQALANKPVRALTLGCEGDLLAGAGGLPIARLGLDKGYLRSGYFYAGPFTTMATPLAWHRLRVEATLPTGDLGGQNGPSPRTTLTSSTGAHLQLFTYAEAATPQLPGEGNPPAFDGPGWRVLPRDERDVLVLSDRVLKALEAGPGEGGDPEGMPAQQTIWLAGILRSDGLNAPTIRQMRLDYSPTTYARYLPAFYRESPRRRLFTELALATLGSELGVIDEEIRALPRLFDPGGAPTEWLPWLAGWLDFDLPEEWKEADQRAHIAEAFDLYGSRGTREGLKRYLKLYAGVDASVEDANASVALFTLDEHVSLGFNTILAPAEEGGAVLGTTAVLGGSHLLNAEDRGAPLFEDVAHRFTVTVYAAQLGDPHIIERVRAVVEREKPAHTDYHLCVIEPAMRVGWQARIGIDSILGGPIPDMRLGEDSTLDEGAILANRPKRTRRLGEGVRLE